MNAYTAAKERYAALGVDTEAALNQLHAIPVSLHCWQGDDVRGFEEIVTAGGGIQSTGNHPGTAGNLEELCAMLDSALALIPGTHKINLHAIYGDLDGVDRNAIEPRHFAGWVDWAKDKHLGLDFNPTLFAHPKAADGLTLSHPYESVREYWIEHCRRCRTIGASFGEALGIPCVVNLWIADGFKDVPADTLGPRLRLKNALDRIYGDTYPAHILIDSLESKLFGIGLESYTVGSYEFYMGYAMEKRLALCLDTGHFHPTETVSAKLAALYPFLQRILLHVSRPVRWDSDHVVLLDDELCAIAKELVRHDMLERVHLGLDYFDGSIDRVAAWAIGARNLRKALLIALLEPWAQLREAEQRFDFTRRLLLMEEFKLLPWPAVWDEYCARHNCPAALV